MTCFSVMHEDTDTPMCTVGLYWCMGVILAICRSLLCVARWYSGKVLGLR